MKLCGETSTIKQKLTRVSTIPPIAIAAAVLCGLSVFSLFTGGAQAQTDAAHIALQHPGWILVPGALVRPDCVHEIPRGAGPRIENGRDTGDVSLHGNIIAHYDPCPEDATIRLATKTPEPQAISNSTGSGLVEYSYWLDTSLGSGDNLSSLVANSFNVPAKPSKNGGVILLYEALQDSTGKYVFAPTMQYGNNQGEGGNYWSLIAYFVTPTNTYVSPPSTVPPGDELFSQIIITGKSGGTSDWSVQIAELAGAAEAELNPKTAGIHWNFAVSGALTVANLSSCSEFPATNVQFQNIVLESGFPNQVVVSAKWAGATFPYGGPSCGFGVTPGDFTTLFW
jgi:hypothetical protein